MSGDVRAGLVFGLNVVFVDILMICKVDGILAVCGNCRIPKIFLDFFWTQIIK